jgi:uncharacterized protein YecT (DUF1311 family)
MKKILFIALLAISFVSVAEDNKFSADYDKCMNKAGPAGDFSGMVSCMQNEFNTQDIALNKAYKSAISRLNKEMSGNLQEAQREWIKYRDANFKLLESKSNYVSDVIVVLEANEWLLNLTASRTKEIDSLSSAK